MLPFGGARAVLAASVVVLLASAARADANGGTIQISNAPIGPYLITAYTDPTPILTGGLTDVSVLLARPETNDLVEDAAVSIRVLSTDGSRAPSTFLATHALATNKLFYAANVSFPAPGDWQVAIHVDGDDGSGDVAFNVEVTQGGLLNTPLTIPLLVLFPVVLGIFWLRHIGRRQPSSGTSADAPGVVRRSRH